MGYYIYMGKLLLPIAPQKLQLKVNNQNKTLTLINEGEINILKKPGLTDIDFDALIPQVKYPFASYKDGFQGAAHFLDEFERMKTSQDPFQYIVVRTRPDGKMLFNTNIKVGLEDYKVTEDVKNGFDLSVSISLKQYKDYGTKTCNVTFSKAKPKPTAKVEPARPADPKKIGIGSDVIVNGRLHRDSYGAGPGQSRSNYKGKVNFINMKGSHPYHVTNPSGGWLGWVTASSVQGV